MGKHFAQPAGNRRCHDSGGIGAQGRLERPAGNRLAFAYPIKYKSIRFL
ncbi:hypothetical protein BN182_3480016 [Clostridioides difficile E9]|nr:hypothetical protein BN182_3480016 [Clostridioides difficile E9]